MNKPTTTLRTLFADHEGFGAMELALALPFLMLLSLGMIDASTMISTKIDYEQAAQRTTDFALARRPTNGNTSNYVAEAKAASGLPADNVTVEIFLECDGTKQSNFDTICPSDQTSARYISVEISNDVATRFDWTALGKMLGFKAFDSTVKITGDSLVRFQ